MINLRDIRYIRLGTQDLDGCAAYATRILGLEAVGRDGDALYFRGDSRDHTIVYFKGDAHDHTAAFEVDDKAELDAAGAALDALGHAVTWGTPDGCAQRRVAAYITFRDPSGNKIDLVTKAHVSGRRYFGSRDAGITSFSHIGLKTTDAPRDEKFWTEVCSAKVSDWIGDAPLLRIDEVHHKIALFPSKVHGVQHINHQVQSIDDIMRSYYFLKEQGVRIVFGPGRHPTSGAMFLYFEGPDGMVYEYSSGVRNITREQEADYRPRQFPFNFESFCMWGSRPDIPEFRK
jgi:2,3-dihydroxy-p-cumate/2,3-dihydroxybenzoate 3,4-dioxygenase